MVLTLHEAASGRVYAAYGGVYICTAIIWFWAVDGTHLACNHLRSIIGKYAQPTSFIKCGN
ncbi:hypothetical protein B9Z44_02385 [Limnohabitans curvus]|uniref:Uncharacterized protein n=1 Tax=Limnohabitans curvus TaxID=323423 RepID=A0A315FYY0_9BURK|nr:hypothetical protein B9Z44_02385 [Limnohabitans curvus]